MDEQDRPLSLVLFSGTDDKLTGAAMLAVGAAAMGRVRHGDGFAHLFVRKAR